MKRRRSLIEEVTEKLLEELSSAEETTRLVRNNVRKAVMNKESYIVGDMDWKPGLEAHLKRFEERIFELKLCTSALGKFVKNNADREVIDGDIKSEEESFEELEKRFSQALDEDDFI